MGSKTIASLVLLGIGAILGWLGDLFSIEHLQRLGPFTLFWIGVFAWIAGTLVFRFWRLDRRSAYAFGFSSEERLWGDRSHFLGTARHHITLGQNHGDAFDLPPLVQHLVCVGLAMCVGLMTLDSRAIDLIRQLPAAMEASSSDYCPQTTTTAAKSSSDITDDPGCALVRRAFALGYAKSLGSCAPKKSAQTAVCTRRQWDEPLLHYAWRLLVGFWHNAHGYLAPDYWHGMQHGFERRARHLRALYEAQRDVVTSRPKAVHILWTNLPDPRNWLTVHTDGLITTEPCTQHYQHMGHRTALAGDGRDASRVLDHILGVLLFDTHYAPPAADCREYHIRWGAAANACQKLAARPVAFLQHAGVLGKVRSLFERRRLAEEVHQMRSHTPSPAAGTKAAVPNAAPPVSQHLVSFQCYVEEARTDVAKRSWHFVLDGQTFVATLVRAPKRLATGVFPAQRYGQVAGLLARGFHYGAMLSRTAVEAATAATAGATSDPAARFAGAWGYLSRLDHLEDADIFAGARWIDSRPGLLDVYPFHVHLRNYVRVFRRQYRLQWGRL